MKIFLRNHIGKTSFSNIKKLEKELFSNPHFDKAFEPLSKLKGPTTIPEKEREVAYFESIKRYNK